MHTDRPADPNKISTLTDLLSLFMAVYLTHWSSHWKSSGSTSYGDHLLFERLYEAVSGEIDVLAEKLLSGIAGPDFSHSVMVSAASDYVTDWETEFPDVVSRSAHAEEVLQNRLRMDFSWLESTNDLPLGLNDFLAAAANTHDTHCYLLNRRMLENSYFGGP